MLFGVIIPSGSALLILPFIFLFLGMICSQAIFKLTSALLSARISTQLKGSYDELVARGGAFAELVKRQRIEGED